MCDVDGNLHLDEGDVRKVTQELCDTLAHLTQSACHNTVSVKKREVTSAQKKQSYVSYPQESNEEMHSHQR
jgi:hypothetical protein